MIIRNALKAFLLATTCLAPLAAFADEMGGVPYNAEIEIGLMGVVGKNSDQAGRYNGLTTTGIDAVGQFAVQARPLWNPDGTWFFDATGENLVFQTGTGLGSGVSGDGPYLSSTSNQWVNSGEVDVKFGKQGTWEGGVDYDAISYTGNVIDSLYTVNGGTATLNNGLVPWGGATAGAATGLTKAYYTIPVLTATGAMQPVQTGTRRDIVGGNFKYMLDDWTFSGALRHEHKEGSMEESFTGPWGGTAFALPIDYTTDRYDLAAAYNTRLNQVSLQYTFSNFHDGNSFVNLPYPFSNTAKPFQESSAYSTPPSNDAHYLTLMAASNMVPKTRVNLNVRVGLEMQDDTFAPDTADPNLTGVASNLNGALQGTSANSLNAIARVFQGKVSVDSHPIANTDARVYYGFDGREVTLNQYKVFTGGTGGETDTAFTAASYVVPQDWLKQNAGGEVGYRIIPEYNTKLTAGYRLDAVDRSNAQVGRSSTNTGTVTLSSSFGPQVDGRLSYEHGERSGSLSYLEPWLNLDGPGTGPTYSGAYYQAPMRSDAVKLRADYSPMENLTGGLFVQFRNENYSYPSAYSFAGTTAPFTGVGEGIRQDYNLTVGPDVNYRPREDVNLHFFYTYERIYYNNIGNGACATSATGACLGSAGYFQNEYTSSVNTAGVSSEWKVSDKLKLGAEYTFSYGSVMFGEFNGVFVSSPTLSYQNVTNYPDVDSVMNNVRLTAAYEVTPGMDLVLRGTWSYFHNNDWGDTANAIQGAGTTAVSIVTPGYESPNYSVVTLMTGVKFKF
jgi:MtrB/PioB family decaheme-associated outer membrane protein